MTDHLSSVHWLSSITTVSSPNFQNDEWFSQFGPQWHWLLHYSIVEGREGSEICSPDVIEYCCTLLAWYISNFNTRIIYISLHCSPRIVFVKVLWNFLNLNNEGKGRVGRGRGKGAADASKIAFRGMWGIHSSEELKWTPAPSPLSQPPTKWFSF